MEIRFAREQFTSRRRVTDGDRVTDEQHARQFRVVRHRREGRILLLGFGLRSGFGILGCKAENKTEQNQRREITGVHTAERLALRSYHAPTKNGVFDPKVAIFGHTDGVFLPRQRFALIILSMEKPFWRSEKPDCTWYAWCYGYSATSRTPLATMTKIMRTSCKLGHCPALGVPAHTPPLKSGRKVLTRISSLMVATVLLSGVVTIFGQEVPAPVAPAPVPYWGPIGAPSPPPIDPAGGLGPLGGGAIGGLPGGGGTGNIGGNTNRTNPREIARANAPTRTLSTNAIIRRQVVQQVQRISLRGPRSDGTNNVVGGAGTNGVERMNPRLFARQNAPAQTANAVAALPMQRVPQQVQRLNLRVRTPLGGPGAAAGNGGNVVPAGGGIAAGNMAPPIEPNAVPLGN